MFTHQLMIQWKLFRFSKGFRWNEISKNGPSKICGRQSLKNLKEYGLLQADHVPSNFLDATLHNYKSIPEYFDPDDIDSISFSFKQIFMHWFYINFY